MTEARFHEVEREILARRPETVVTPSLEGISALMELLGEPQRAYPVIHVAGTNGKTSTTRMIESLLRHMNLRVGCYTSPHLTSICERVRVDGEPLAPDRFAAVYDDVVPYVRMVDARRPTPLTFFEVLTGMAFAAFADAPVDVAVIEVGMGGVWDATNVADGQVAVVTPVSVDHVRYLGDRIEGIAAEKAGIIKPESIAVLAHQRIEVAEVLLRRAAEVGATVAREGLEFGVRHRDLAVGGQQLALQGLRDVYDEVFLPLFGAYQATNAACALAAVEAFGGGESPLDADLVRAAFAAVRSPGRLEVVRRSPTVIVDAAHNPAGMAATAEAVQESFTFTRLVGVVAVMADKDVPGVLGPLEPLLAEVVVTRNSTSRALPVPDLAAVAAEVFGPDRVHRAERLDDALDLAVRLAEETGELGGAGVLVTGSVVTAGEARLLLRGDKGVDDVG